MGGGSNGGRGRGCRPEGQGFVVCTLEVPCLKVELIGLVTLCISSVLSPLRGLEGPADPTDTVLAFSEGGALNLSVIKRE